MNTLLRPKKIKLNTNAESLLKFRRQIKEKIDMNKKYIVNCKKNVRQIGSNVELLKFIKNIYFGDLILVVSIVRIKENASNIYAICRIDSYNRIASKIIYDREKDKIDKLVGTIFRIPVELLTDIESVKEYGRTVLNKTVGTKQKEMFEVV